MTLNVAFLWHMHQPLYRDPEEGFFLLPWVRLHATKDYLFVARMMEKYPELHHTVNFSPCLLEQIVDYVENGIRDFPFLLTEKEARSLEEREKIFIIRKFFSACEDTLIGAYPRYRELLELKKSCGSDEKKLAESFGTAETLDLQVLFNLAWTNPIHDDEFPLLRNLREKGRGYSEEEKRGLLDVHIEIMKRVVPAYKNLLDEGVIDLTVSPYYHPILPILIDSMCAGEADPGLRDPGIRVKFPEDAEWNVDAALDEACRLFGLTPKGMWPSEGSISQDTIEMLEKHGIKFTFSDEAVLSKTLDIRFKREPSGIPSNLTELYRPWKAEGGELSIFFRDHFISDLIGFAYNNWDESKSASHLLSILGEIDNSIKKQGDNPDDFIVSIIFDGENPWEYYRDYGIPFLTSLFENLMEKMSICVTTFEEYLERKDSKVCKTFTHLKPGSWIDGTFRIWFGHDEDIRAWENVIEARKQLDIKDIDINTKSNALKYIRISEGSDWYWWYGDDHFTPDMEEFDSLFRKNLMKSYSIIGSQPPENIMNPIHQPKRVLEVETGIFELRPKGFVSPTIDGRMTDYYEWANAASFRQERIFGAMHRSGVGVIDRIYGGFDSRMIFLRVDFTEDAKKGHEKFIMSIYTNKGKISLDFFLDVNTLSVRENPFPSLKIEYEKIFELSLERDDLFLETVGDRIFEFQLHVLTENLTEERCPPSGSFRIRVTDDDPSLIEWMA